MERNERGISEEEYLKSRGALTAYISEVKNIPLDLAEEVVDIMGEGLRKCAEALEERAILRVAREGGNFDDIYLEEVKAWGASIEGRFKEAPDQP